MEFESFLSPMPRVVAHRGDSAFFPENTAEAFSSAASLGIDVIETDVHLTKDGEIVIWHDPTLERNTDGKGTLESHTLAELKRYDAGYTFTRDGGKTYPFRGKGVKLITLSAALELCPDERFNIDLKSQEPEIVDRFISVIREHKAENRICAASFHLDNLKKLRKAAPDILTSITTLEVIPLLLKEKLHMLSRSFDRKIIFQVPVRQYGITVVDRRFVEEMHKRDAVVMVWTINDESEMRRLFSIGVDTIMTDNPRLLIKVAEDMGVR